MWVLVTFDVSLVVQLMDEKAKKGKEKADCANITLPSGLILIVLTG
jgi:hypothetical protein